MNTNQPNDNEETEPSFNLNCSVCGEYSGGRGPVKSFNDQASLHMTNNPGHIVTVERGPDVPKNKST